MNLVRVIEHCFFFTIFNRMYKIKRYLKNTIFLKIGKRGPLMDTGGTRVISTIQIEELLFDNYRKFGCLIWI
jgi:hypothetical protein